jgi:hypothetical protein
VEQLAPPHPGGLLFACQHATRLRNSRNDSSPDDTWEGHRTRTRAHSGRADEAASRAAVPLHHTTPAPRGAIRSAHIALGASESPSESLPLPEPRSPVLGGLKSCRRSSASAGAGCQGGAATHSADASCHYRRVVAASRFALSSPRLLARRVPRSRPLAARLRSSSASLRAVLAYLGHGALRLSRHWRATAPQLRARPGVRLGLRFPRRTLLVAPVPSARLRLGSSRCTRSAALGHASRLARVTCALSRCRARRRHPACGGARARFGPRSPAPRCARRGGPGAARLTTGPALQQQQQQQQPKQQQRQQQQHAPGGAPAARPG